MLTNKDYNCNNYAHVDINYDDDCDYTYNDDGDYDKDKGKVVKKRPF